MTRPTLTIAVPAYNRSTELGDLLTSVLEANELPDELLIAEDHSPQRRQIRELVEQHLSSFAERGCMLRLIENPVNLGYDGNVRGVIQNASSEWVMLLGNDDVVTPNGILYAREFLSAHPTVPMVSRSCFRFKDDRHRPIGHSRAAVIDMVFQRHHVPPSMAFRLCGFVGGLIIKRDWANQLATTRYDGTLYYQIYLAFHAYCGEGLGYIGRTAVGGRVGNPPLFGAAATEKGLHVPGSYAPQSRAFMWKSVLHIAEDVGAVYDIDLVTSVRKELDQRQCFHVYEMMAAAPRPILVELRTLLKKIGLQRSLVAEFLFSMNYILGQRASAIYQVVRKFVQA